VCFVYTEDFFSPCVFRNSSTIGRSLRGSPLGLTSLNSGPSTMCSPGSSSSPRLMSEYNLKTLRETTAGVTREVWRTVPGLHVGEALLASPQLPHPVLLKIRPAKTMRVKLYEKVREPVPEALP